MQSHDKRLSLLQAVWSKLWKFTVFTQNMGRKKKNASSSFSSNHPESLLNEVNETNNANSPFDLNDNFQKKWKINFEVALKFMADLLNKKWKVFRASLLYNFSEKTLKLIAKKINNELNSRKKFGSDIVYSTSFKINKELKLKENSAEAIQVEITSNVKKKFYLGYFISFLKEKENTGIGYSLALLVDTRSSDVHKVHLSLSKIFDCDIYPVTFLVNNLITLFVKFLENPEEKTVESQEVITLTYKIPGCNSGDNLDITLILEDTTIVLAFTIDGLRGSFPGITNAEIISEFYNRLLNHIYKIYKVDLTMADLNKIVFPHVFITVDGQVKTSSENSMNLILNILQQICPLSYLSNYK